MKLQFLTLLTFILFKFSFSQKLVDLEGNLTLKYPYNSYTFINYNKYKLSDTLYSSLTKNPLEVQFLANIIFFDNSKTLVRNTSVQCYNLVDVNSNEVFCSAICREFEIDTCSFQWVIPLIENEMNNYFIPTKIELKGRIADSLTYAIPYPSKIIIIPKVSYIEKPN